MSKRDVVLAFTELLIWWRETYRIFNKKYKIAAVTTCFETEVAKSMGGEYYREMDLFRAMEASWRKGELNQELKDANRLTGRRGAERALSKRNGVCILKTFF